MNRFNLTVSEMIEFLGAFGYRVIPKVDILRLEAEIPVDTLYDKRDPAVIESVTRMLAEMIGYELRAVLKPYHRSEDDKMYLTTTYRTVIEVIKP